MSLAWLWSFNADVAIADYLAHSWRYGGWETSDAAQCSTNATTSSALSSPDDVTQPGDTHVATCDAGEYLATPSYLGLLAVGGLNKGIFCARMRWVSGSAVAAASSPLLAIVDDSGNELMVIHAQTAGTSTTLQTALTTTILTGSTVFKPGNTYNLALIYDYSGATPTIQVYIDGSLELAATDSAAATVAQFRLGSHGGLIAWNTLRWYDDVIADATDGLKTGIWMQVRVVDSVTQTGWTQVGSPASDVAALASDLTTGLERSDEGSIAVEFENPTFATTDVHAVAVVALGTMDGLATGVSASDGSGEIASFKGSVSTGATAIMAVSTQDSDANPLTRSDTDSLTATVEVRLAVPDYVTLTGSMAGSFVNLSGNSYTTAEYASGLWRFQAAAGQNGTFNGTKELDRFEIPFDTLLASFGGSFNPATQAVQLLLTTVTFAGGAGLTGDRWGVHCGIIDTSADNDGISVAHYDAVSNIALFAYNDPSNSALSNLLTHANNVLQVSDYVRLTLWWDSTDNLRCYVEWIPVTSSELVPEATHTVSTGTVDKTTANLRLVIGPAHPNSGASVSGQLWESVWQARVISRPFMAA